MSTLPEWNTQTFGCLIRDDVAIRSLMRTTLTASLPVPVVSRTADTQAPLELDFSIELDGAAFNAWVQWTTYDLNDGALPFTMYLPWGTRQPRVRARLAGAWNARHLDTDRWVVAGVMEIERESLPRFSGGVYA